ncbi:hypothetical protein TNCV_3211371 [Trichonephila clavipes]|uniref:Uncharacterized protein n=1 Tax=Trichonephila clavipes TaxID=2585209 RepID=A0A8X6VEV7_TRICX|nr:hypothetical protein TNCV_3211371 [Trichonephila clavipes]
MGGRLRALRNSMKSRQLSDGKGISGRGRLRDNEISKLQQYYGLAIQRNMNSVSDKFKAITMMSSDAVRINLNECMQKYNEYSERFFALLSVFGKKAVSEWCMKEGLIASSYVCPKCGKPMELRERTGKIVNDGF